MQDDAWLSWRRCKQDENAYLLLEADYMYTDWILKFERKIASEEKSQMIDSNFHKNQLDAGSNTELFKQQENHTASILQRVLQTSEGKRLTRKHPEDPRQVWELHQTHSTSSATSKNICTGLGKELAKLKIVVFDTPTKRLDTFDSYLTKFNKISPISGQIPNSLAVMYLQAATCGNIDLLSIWTQCETIKKQMTRGGPTPSYDEYYKYMLQYAKKLEVAVERNTPALKTNSSKTAYLTPYSPSDPFFSQATDPSTYMVSQEVDVIQYILQCNQALKEGRLRPPQRTHRKPVCEKLKIQNSTWS